MKAFARSFKKSQIASFFFLSPIDTPNHHLPPTNLYARDCADMSQPGDDKRHDVDIQALEEKNTLHSEVLVNKDLMSNAFEGENAEHQETVWQAVKSHKMACFWAFVSTHSCFFASIHFTSLQKHTTNYTAHRPCASPSSWRVSICS